MANIIDTLVVLLKLDPSQFNEQQKKAVSEYRKSGEQIKKQSAEIESDLKQVGVFFGNLRNQIIGTTLALLGFKGASAFITDTVRTVADLGRQAKIAGETTEEMGRIIGAVKNLGGDSAAATSSIIGMTQAFQQFAMTGQSEVVPYFRALGVELVGADGKLRGVRAIYLDLADRFAKMKPGEAKFFADRLGLDAGTLQLLMKGREEVGKILNTMNALGVATEKDAKNFQALEKAANEFAAAAATIGRSLLSWASPAITDVLDKLTTALAFPRLILDSASSDPFAMFRDMFKGGSPSTGGAPAAPASHSSVFDLFQKLERSGPQAVSPKGAVGRNQIMPGTATQYGFDPGRLKEPAYNDQVAKAIQADLYKKYNGDLEAMAVAYNAGPGRANAWLREGRNDAMLPAETQAYLARTRELAGGKNASVTNIGTIVVNTQATDATGIARDIGGAMQNNSMVTQGNAGPQ